MIPKLDDGFENVFKTHKVAHEDTTDRNGIAEGERKSLSGRFADLDVAFELFHLAQIVDVLEKTVNLLDGLIGLFGGGFSLEDGETLLILGKVVIRVDRKVKRKFDVIQGLVYDDDRLVDEAIDDRIDLTLHIVHRLDDDVVNRVLWVDETLYELQIRLYGPDRVWRSVNVVGHVECAVIIARV